MERLELRIRHDDPESKCSDISFVRSPKGGRINFESGEYVGHPTVRALEFSVGTCGNRDGLAQVSYEPSGLGTTLEVVANLAVPIPGRETKRVYLISSGVGIRGRVCDADTGEEIMATGFRVKIEGGKTPLAWVDPYVPPSAA